MRPGDAHHTALKRTCDSRERPAQRRGADGRCAGDCRSVWIVGVNGGAFPREVPVDTRQVVRGLLPRRPGDPGSTPGLSHLPWCGCAILGTKGDVRAVPDAVGAGRAGATRRPTVLSGKWGRRCETRAPPMESRAGLRGPASITRR